MKDAPSLGDMCQEMRSLVEVLTLIPSSKLVSLDLWAMGDGDAHLKFSGRRVFIRVVMY